MHRSTTQTKTLGAILRWRTLLDKSSLYKRSVPSSGITLCLGMSRVSPTAEGFRAAFRRPLLTSAEIAWRWVVGATATVLFFFGFIEYLDTLPVTNADVLFLRTRQPFLVWQAVAHILRGSVRRALLSLMLAGLLLTLIWLVAASLGRLATVEAMIEYFRARFPAAGETRKPAITAAGSKNDQIFALLRLNFLRVALVVAAIVGLAGGAIIAGSTSSPTHPRTGLEVALFLPIAALVCLLGYALNWLLSLAAVFVVRDNEEAVAAIASAVALCRERAGALLGVSSWTGAAHLIAFVGASSIVSMPLALAGLLPLRLVVLGVIAITLGYFVVADWLYIARLAGFVCITEAPEVLASPLPPVSPTPAVQSSGIIDRDELILSDVPYSIPS